MISVSLNLADDLDLEPFRKQMIDGGLYFSKSTDIFKVFNEEKVHIGFTGLMVKGRKARLKNSFVFPEFRRRGYFDLMIRERIGMAKMMGCTKADCIVTGMSKGWYDKNGWRMIREYSKFWHYETDL